VAKYTTTYQVAYHTSKSKVYSMDKEGQKTLQFKRKMCLSEIKCYYIQTRGSSPNNKCLESVA